jgi:hypothetical protein
VIDPEIFARPIRHRITEQLDRLWAHIAERRARNQPPTDDAGAFEQLAMAFFAIPSAFSTPDAPPSPAATRCFTSHSSTSVLGDHPFQSSCSASSALRFGYVLDHQHEILLSLGSVKGHGAVT